MRKEDTGKVENYCMSPKNLWLNLQRGPIAEGTHAPLVSWCFSPLPPDIKTKGEENMAQYCAPQKARTADGAPESHTDILGISM